LSVEKLMHEAPFTGWRAIGCDSPPPIFWMRSFT
jgi:hypothetical protein